MEKSKKNKISGKFLILIFFISLVLVTFVSISFISFSNRKVKVISKELNGGTITLNYSSNSSNFNISNAIPTSNLVAISNNTKGQYFDFSIDTKLDEARLIEYEISLDKKNIASSITNDDIRIYLEKEESGTYNKVSDPVNFTPLKEDSDLGTPKGSMVIYKNVLKKSTTENYRLRMWLSDKALSPSLTNYSVDINISGIAK